MQFKTKVPTVDIKQRSHDPKQVTGHIRGERGRGRLVETGHECNQMQSSVYLCWCVCWCVCVVCAWFRDASDVALSTVNLQLLRCLNRKNNNEKTKKKKEKDLPVW